MSGTRFVLKDGIKYMPYTYRNEGEIESTMIEHYKAIFGNDAILFTKHKIRSRSGIGTVPDAFAVSLKERRWYVVEVELSSHPLHKHILPQITKFYRSIKNSATRKILKDGRIKMPDGHVCSSPSGSIKYLTGGLSANGWAAWRYRAPDGKGYPIEKLRKKLLR